MGTDSDVETDGGETAPGVPRDELYTVVRAAVKDAIFDLLATALLLGIGLLFIVAGVRGLLGASAGLGYVFGGANLGLGLVFIAAAFDLIPSFHERISG